MNNQSLIKNQVMAKNLKENIKNVFTELTKEAQCGYEDGRPTNGFKIFEEADTLKFASKYNIHNVNVNGYMAKDYNGYRTLILTLKDLLKLYNEHLYFTRANYAEEMDIHKVFIEEVKSNIQYQIDRLMEILNKSLANKNYNQYRCLINCYDRLLELDRYLNNGRYELIK